MLDIHRKPARFSESDSAWVRSFSLESIKCLIVCRGPVRKEALDVFDDIGAAEYGILLSEKDSIVYPKCLAPELRGFRYPRNVHRVVDYMGATKEEREKGIREIIEIAVSNGYTHIFAGYGFMAEDADFIAAVERAGLRFMGPGSHVARSAGAKDEAKKLARRLQASVTPGVDNPSALALLARVSDRDGLVRVAREAELSVDCDAFESDEDLAEAILQASYEKRIELVTITELQAIAERCAGEIWAKYPGRRIRFKFIGGGGGKGQRLVTNTTQVAAAVMEVLAESKVVQPGSNRNFLIELNIENTRHNEIQLIGNGTWCIALGGRDCSVQMHEQKLLELSLTREMLEQEIEHSWRAHPDRARVLEIDKHVLTEMEAEAERFGEAVKLDSVSTYESIVDGANHFFMEMNTRIQVEHRVTEMVYRLKFVNPEDSTDFFYVESLVEAMALLSLHGERLPLPERVHRYVAGGEVRINATNAALQPHAGGLVMSWSRPLPHEVRDDQGISTPNPDTGHFMHYCVAGAYDSNIALIVTHGSSREDHLKRLADILRRTELRGQDLQTNMPVHYGLINWFLGKDAMAKPSTQFMVPYLAAVGGLARVIRDVDLEIAWNTVLSRQPSLAAKETLRKKETLILRPVARLFANPHLLAGFVGLHEHRFLKREGDRVRFVDNPVLLLAELYHYLNFEFAPGKPASEMIWDHDQRLLETATAFYDELRERTGIENWDDLCSVFDDDDEVHEKIAGWEPGLWDACVQSHRGFQVGMELLLIVANVAARAGFLDIRLDEKLEPVFPPVFLDPQERQELIKALAPPPKASSDEIVTPMGGHFYAREAPHLPPLVEEGSRFAAGQPLFIIEVMKMFNKVSVPFSGTITKCLMSDQDSKIVVKGQPIFKITPDELLKEESVQEISARRRALTLSLLAN